MVPASQGCYECEHAFLLRPCTPSSHQFLLTAAFPVLFLLCPAPYTNLSGGSPRSTRPPSPPKKSHGPKVIPASANGAEMFYQRANFSLLTLFISAQTPGLFWGHTSEAEAATLPASC